MKRLYLLYLFVVVQVLLSIFLLSDQNDRWSYYLLYDMQVLVTMGVVLEALFHRSLFSQRRSTVITLTVVYLAYHLFQSVILRELPEYQIEFNFLKGLWALIIWIFPVLAIPIVLRSETDIDSFVQGIRIGVALSSLSVIACYLASEAGIEFGEIIAFSDGKVRYFGPLGDQVSYVSALGLMIAISRRRAMESALHLTAIFLTGTRGVMLVLAIAVLALLIYSLRYRASLSHKLKRRLRVGAVAVLLVGAGIAISPMGDFLFERLFNPERFEVGFSTRTGSMSIGLDIFQEHPWFGVGYSGFSEHAQRMGGHLEFAAFDPVFLANSANPYIEAAVSGGVVGLAIYLLLVLKVLQYAHRSVRLARGHLQLQLLGVSVWLIGFTLGLHTAIVVQPTSLTCLYFFTCACFIERAFVLLETELAKKREVSSPQNSPAPVTRHYPAVHS